MSIVARIGHAFVMLGALVLAASLACPMITNRIGGEVQMGYDHTWLFGSLALGLPTAAVGLVAKPKSQKRWAGVWLEWLALGPVLLSVYWFFLRESPVANLVAYEWGRYVLLAAAALLAPGALLATLPKSRAPSAEEQAEALLNG